MAIPRECALSRYTRAPRALPEVALCKGFCAALRLRFTMIAFKFAKAKPAKKRELGGAAGLFDGGLDAEQPSAASSAPPEPGVVPGRAAELAAALRERDLGGAAPRDARAFPRALPRAAARVFPSLEGADRGQRSRIQYRQVHR